MRKFLLFLFLIFILSGCATYKFQKSDASGGKGYLVCYDGKPITEYTVGTEKTLPDLSLAKERFKRRRSKVEFYYKRMDQIESRLKGFFWDPPVMALGLLGGVLNWPFRAVTDYKYNHNPKYKARVDKLDEEKEALETARVAKLKRELDAYVAKDLVEEKGGQGIVEAALSEAKPEPQAQVQQKAASVSQTVVSAPAPAPEPVIPSAQEPVVAKDESVVTSATEPVVSATTVAEVKPLPAEEVPAVKIVSEPPVAVIIAKPVKGYSPLKVTFSGQKSFSKSGKIVSYLWNFGDGDTSTLKNPENTYWSTTFGSRNFTATLTVRDQAGSISSATSVIEVITR
ncbi:MAG: PKD domain-containing protein [Candidatus Omnitrophica bacterium]|nr:PKD domain-containing protein [Candidatus Omnitrophota bacterium]